MNPRFKEANQENLALIYGLLLASPFTLGLSGLIGVIWAFTLRNDLSEWLDTHYTYITHTVGKGLVFLVVSLILVSILVGIAALAALFIWWMVRSVKGLRLLLRNQEVPNAYTWLW